MLGNSGCGETTLLRPIAGVHGTDAGQVRFDGDVTNVNDAQQLQRLPAA